MRSALEPTVGWPRSFGGRNTERKKADRRRASKTRRPESPMNERKRIAITGIGMVTPVGNDARTTWANLQAGRSGLGRIRGFDASGFSVHIGAEVKDFEAEAVIHDHKLLKFASRSHQFALAAAEEALADAGLRPEPATSERWGLSVGAGMLGVTFDELRAVHQF